MSSRLLQTNHIGIGFEGASDIVRDASIEVLRGEVTGLAGPSGSGKSLTLWSLLGILPDRATMSGEIILYNANGAQTVISKPEEVKTIAGKQFRIIPQNPFTSLNPVIRCGVQVMEMLGGKKSDKEIVIAHLSSLGFEDSERIYHSYPFELSGGQLQRVVIAMATIGKPELILADEPTTALDVKTQMEVLNLLRSYVQEHQIGLLLVTHDLGVLGQYCDRLYALHQGVTQLLDRTGVTHQPTEPVFRFNEDRPLVKLLEVDDLGVNYRNRRGVLVRAVDNISFYISAGEVLGIAGATGCGKSTIAKVLSGLKEPQQGSIKFRSEVLDFDKRPGLRREIQLIFQDPYSALYPHWTIGQYLEEAILVHDRDRKSEKEEVVGSILRRVGLSADFASRFPYQLSGGERQRVQIARALLVRPSLLICDEITSGLDSAIRSQILELLTSVQEQHGISLVFISHDLEVIRSLADRVIIMDEGKIVESGPVEDIFTSAKHEVTRALLKASTRGIWH